MNTSYRIEQRIYNFLRESIVCGVDNTVYLRSRSSVTMSSAVYNQKIVSKTDHFDEEITGTLTETAVRFLVSAINPLQRFGLKIAAHRH